MDFTLCVVMRRLVDSAKDARGRRSFDAFLLAQFAKTRADNNTFSIPRNLSGHDFREKGDFEYNQPESSTGEDLPKTK